MNVLVFGGGAVGLGMSSCLMAAGFDPDIVARGNTTDALTKEGLHRTGLIGEALFKNVRAFENLSGITPGKTYDYILVCTKSNDSENAAVILSNHPGLIHDRTCVVLCQNG